MNIHLKKKWRSKGKRLLSFMLVIAMLLGIIPQSAYAATTTTQTEQAERDILEEYGIIAVKENLQFSCNKATFDTNVYTGRNFVCYGSKIEMKKRVEAAGNIYHWCGSFKAGEEKKDAAKIKLPDIRSGIEDKSDNWEKELGSLNLHDDTVVKGFYKSTGDIQISKTKFKGDCYLLAEKSIQYSVDSLNKDGGRVVLYSENGDITISGSKIVINGVLAAPHGMVKIYADDVTINGRIYAAGIEMSGTNFNVTSSDEDLELIRDENVIKVYDSNEDFGEGQISGLSKEEGKLKLQEIVPQSQTVEKQYNQEGESGVTADVTVNQSEDTIHYQLQLGGKSGLVNLPGVTDSYFQFFEGNLYAFVNQEMHWNDAKAFCEAAGGHLATTSSAEENTFLKKMAQTKSSGYTALGFSDAEKEGDWRWVTGEEVVYTNWNSGEPNNSFGSGQNHAYMYSNGTWDDGYDWVMSPFFCEWELEEDQLQPVGRNIELVVEVNGTVTDSGEWECLKQDNGVSTMAYFMESILPAQTVSLDMEILPESGEGYRSVIQDSYYIYYDQTGKGHRIEMGDLWLPVYQYPQNGTWTTIYDSEKNGISWGSISWDAVQAGNSNIKAHIRAYDTADGIVTEAEAGNGERLKNIKGRYVEITMTLEEGGDNRTPVIDKVVLASAKAKGVPGVLETIPEGELLCKNTLTAGSSMTAYHKLTGGLYPLSANVEWSVSSADQEKEVVDYTVEEISPYLARITISEAGTYYLQAVCHYGEEEIISRKKILVCRALELPDIESLVKEEDINILLDMPDYGKPSESISGSIYLPGGQIIESMEVWQNDKQLEVSEESSFEALLPEEDGTVLFEIKLVFSDGTIKEYSKEVIVDSSIPVIHITPEKESYTAGEQGTFRLEIEDVVPVKSTTILYDGNELYYDGNGIISTGILLEGKHTLTAIVMDAAGNEASKNYEFTVAAQATENPPVDGEFGIYLSKNRAAVGDTIEVQVFFTKEMETETAKVTVGKKEISIKDGTGSFVAEEAGNQTVMVTVKDKAGNEHQAEAVCHVYDATDKEAPKIEITAPQADAAITDRTEIIGSVTDDKELASYLLEYAAEGSDQYVTIKKSNGPKENEVLGIFDATMLLNGRYTIRLTAEDKGGNTSTLEQKVYVEGNLKIGAMNIGFTDVTAQMGGTTVSVNRMYDSRNKEKGDFGIGWTLAMQGMELIESASLTEGYEMKKVGSFLSTGYQMTETANHDVVVTYGDGTSDRFELTFTPERQALVPISETKIGYHCVTNQKVKLEILEDTSAYVSGSELMFYDEDMYETLNYKLTTADGIEIYLNKEDGVYQIVDGSDNVIHVDKDGYHAENGKSITFTRDKEDRIIRVEDPAGNAIIYDYDGNGDLAAVTDNADRTVTFTYDEKHNLMSITDPSGVAVARNEYDDEGRLVATIDANGNRTEYDHDIDGRSELVTDRLGNKTLYIYDSFGNVLNTTDANGNTIKCTYDSFGNVLSRTDAKGQVTSYDYDTNGNLTTVTDVNGNQVKNTYNENNLITSIKTVDDVEILVDYDQYGNISKTTDANENVTTYENDKNGNVTGIADKIGQVMSAKYDSNGNVIEATDSAGNKTVNTYNEEGNCITQTTYAVTEDGMTERTIRYVYNDAGELVQTIDADGNATSVERNANGKMSATIDSKERRTEYLYDDFGNIKEIIYSDGTTERYKYDAEGRNTETTNRLGLTIRYSYDKVGNLLQQTDARGNCTVYTYDENYNLLTVTSPTGAVTTYGYDELNRNTEIRDAKGNVTRFTYDETSLQTSMTDAKGNITSYEYDKNGNRTKIIYADGTYIETKYDERGRIIWQKDTAERKTEYTYDENDRLVEVKQNNNAVTRYTYDQTGNLTGVTDANQNTTTYVYDENSRRIKTILPDGCENSSKYDQYGMLISTKDYNGLETCYSYDEEDRLTKQVTGTEKTEYIYDTLGRLVTVKTGSSRVDYSYNAYGELSAKTYENGQGISYLYDKYGRVEEIQVTQSGEKIFSTKYGYDSMNRLTRVTGHDGSATVYTYDENGNRKAATFANGVVMQYTYDECNRLTLQKAVDKDGNVVAQYHYTLGKGGERIKVEEEGPEGTVVTAYAYDQVGRLTKEVIKKGEKKTEYAYAYDDAGNRTEKKTDGSKTTYSYNSRNQLVEECGEDETVWYHYDANGNLLEQTGDNTSVVYAYDVYNRLIRYTSGAKRETYTYDAEGVRRSRQNAGETVFYISDTSGSLSQTLAETDGSGSLTAAYTRADSLLSQTRGENTSYYLYDGHGDIRGLLDTDGAVTDTYRYNAYGELLEKTGDTENHYLYTGEVCDDMSNLYYLRARYMNPSTGTFISMDTYEGNIYDPDTLHKYLYANGNPVTYNDPSGNFASFVEMDVAAGIQSVLQNRVDVYYMGILSGIMNSAFTALMGGTESDCQKAFVEGFLMGAGLAAVRYFAVAAKILSLAQFYLLIASADACVSLTMGLISIQEGYSEGAVIYGVLTILSFAQVCSAYNMIYSVEVIGSKGSIRAKLDKANSSKLMVEGGKSSVKTDFYVTKDGTVIPSNKVKTNSQYDRLEVEIYSGKSVRPNNAVDDWNDFLGDNQTDINPFTGKKSVDRIWSADGKRSIRFGEHEMGGMGTRRFHYHKETWYDDYVINEVQRIQQR